ncbi:MAG: 6-bladed beta-propeller [Bacteroidota bacterium]
MSPKPFLIPALLCCMLFSLPAFSQVKKIYLSPKAAKGGKQSLFIDSIRIIPLERKPGVEIDGEYAYPIITDKYFIIKAYNSSEIYLFDREGRFLKKIANKLLKNQSVGYDKSTNKIVIRSANKNYTLTERDWLKVTIDYANPRNKKYYRKYEIDLSDPEYKITKSDVNPYEVLNASPFYKDYFYNTNIKVSDLFKDTLDYELKIYKDKQLITSYFPYHKQKETRHLYGYGDISISGTGIDSVRLFTRPYYDTIYKLQGDSIFPFAEIVLPQENSLPASFFSEPFKNKTARENFEANSGWLLRQIHNYSENDRFIFFSISYQRNYGRYLYDKKTQVAYDYKKIKADSTQFNLPILQSQGAQKDKDRYYSYVSLDDLKAAFGKDKNMPWPESVKAIADGKERYFNNAIVEYIYKND